MRGYLEIFYCSFSVPSASSRKGGKVEYFKGCEPGTGEKLGLCACVIHVLLVFFHSWNHSIWDLDLTQVEKPKHTDLKVMGLFSLQVPVNSLLGHWIWSNSFLLSCFESPPVLGCRRGCVTIPPAGGVDVIPSSGVSLLTSQLSCDSLWKDAVYVHISPFNYYEKGIQPIPNLSKVSGLLDYWTSHSFERAFKIGIWMYGFPILSNTHCSIWILLMSTLLSSLKSLP